MLHELILDVTIYIASFDEEVWIKLVRYFYLLLYIFTYIITKLLHIRTKKYYFCKL